MPKSFLIALLCAVAMSSPAAAAVFTGLGMVQHAMAPIDPVPDMTPSSVKLACEVAFFDSDGTSRLLAEGATLDEAIEHLQQALPEDGYCERLEITALR